MNWVATKIGEKWEGIFFVHFLTGTYLKLFEYLFFVEYLVFNLICIIGLGLTKSK